MNKKINNLKEAEYYSSFNLVGENIVKARKKKESETINDMYYCWQEVGFYVNNLISESRFYEDSLSQYRSDKLRAVIRARKAEEEVAKLKVQIDKLKTKINVGL